MMVSLAWFSVIVSTGVSFWKPCFFFFPRKAAIAKQLNDPHTHTHMVNNSEIWGKKSCESKWRRSGAWNELLMFQYTDRYSNRLFIFPYSLASPVGFQSRDKSLEEKSRPAAKKGVLKEEKKKKKHTFDTGEFNGGHTNRDFSPGVPYVWRWYLMLGYALVDVLCRLK